MTKKDILKRVGAGVVTFTIGVLLSIGSDMAKDQLIATYFKKTPDTETEEDPDEEENEEDSEE